MPESQSGNTADQAEQRYQHEISQLMRQEALGALARRIAHDFNNVLQVISGRLELLEQLNTLPAEALEDLRSAHGGLDLAYRLLRQFRPYVLTTDPAATLIPVEVLLHAVAARMQGQLAAGVTLRCICVEPDLTLCGDRLRIEVALTELLLNASEALAAREGCIELRAERRRRAEPGERQMVERDFVCLTVQDDGPGMAPDQLRQAFDPFYSTKGERRGVGLAIVRNVARSHDGTVEAHSIPGEGMAVTIWLPAAAV